MAICILLIKCSVYYEDNIYRSPVAAMQVEQVLVVSL